MTPKDFQYVLAAATPHVFDFARNAKAVLPEFADPDHSGPGADAVQLAKNAPVHGTGRGIYAVFAENLHMQGFLRSEKVAGHDLKSVNTSFTDRIDTMHGRFLAYGRFRGVRSTDRINGPLHILLRTIAIARLNELAGHLNPADAAKLYAACGPRVISMMRSETSWDDYLTNVMNFCKMQDRSRWRKIRRGRATCLQLLTAIDMFSYGRTDAFTNCVALDFEVIRKDERKLLLDMADRGDWDDVIAHIEDNAAQDDARKFAYIGVFNPKNIEAVIIADLEAQDIKSATKDLILANFFIEWGYAARGSTGADQVGNDNFRLFEERLSKALSFIRPYVESETPSQHVLRLYLDLKPHIWFEDKQQLDEKVALDARTLFPDSYYLARRQLHFMVDKWGGSKELAWEFATEFSDRYPQDSMLACLPFYAIFEEYLMIEMIENKTEEAAAFIKGNDAKKRLAPYLERVLQYPKGEILGCYSIPVGWYIWAGNYEEAWNISQTVGGLYAREGVFGTYFTDNDSEGIESCLISMFGPVPEFAQD